MSHPYVAAFAPTEDDDMTVEVNGRNISLPRAAFDEGARVLAQAVCVPVKTAWYKDSICAFLAALTAHGIKVSLQ
jgi:hypothetical protein